MNKYQKAIYQIVAHGEGYRPGHKILKKTYKKGLKKSNLGEIIEFKEERKKLRAEIKKGPLV